MPKAADKRIKRIDIVDFRISRNSREKNWTVKIIAQTAKGRSLVWLENTLSPVSGFGICENWLDENTD